MKIDFVQKDDYLIANVSGNYSLDKANQTLIILLDHLEANKSSRVLVNCIDLIGQDDTMKQFYHAEFGANQFIKRFMKGTLQSTKFSYVLNDKFFDTENFGETVAVNRGLHVKVFNNLEEAIEWLFLNN